MNINEFFEQLDLDNNIVFITAFDEASKFWGGVTTKQRLGLKADLKFHDSYIAVVDKANNFVYEKWGREYLQYEYILADGQVVKITSAGFGLSPNISEINIGETKNVVDYTGLNFVVFDKTTKNLSCVYNCNTYTDSSLKINSYEDIAKRENNVLVKIRDCFSAGCSVAQYCIDKGYKNPLILSYSADLLWEIYIQFFYLKSNINGEFYILGDDVEVANEILCCCPTQKRFINYKATDLLKYDIIFAFTGKAGYFWNILPFKKTLYIDNILSKLSTYTYAERPVYDFINRHPMVKIVMLGAPFITRNEHLTELEKWELTHNSFWVKSELYKNIGGCPIFTSLDHLGYTNDEVRRLLSPPSVYTDEYGCTKFNDNGDELINIVNGRRKTAYQPKEYKNTIWLFGACVFYGYGAPYDKTVESYLQKIMVDNGEEYLIENCGQFCNGRHQDELYNINALPVKDGDIIFICMTSAHVEGVPYFGTRKLFVRPHNYGEVFIDGCHVNEIGYKVIAEKMYEYLKENNFFDGYEYPHKEITPPHMFGIPEWTRGQSYGLNTEQQTGLNEYKQTLKELHKKMFGRIGAIVMNCNPFTLGHRYLIEYASKQVSHLFIFAVEEDKSVFPFADRIELIRKGTADLSNVTVLPSGKYVISSLTFSDYFNKSKLQDTTIDPSMDVELFATQIAPELGITVRFAGEEPLDKVTMQYNNSMRQILPKYGIEFEEIPRKEFEGGVISASRVRACLKANDFETISKIVPPTTLEYLKTNYEELIGKL